MLETRLGGRAGASITRTAAILLLAGLAGCSKSVPLDPVESEGSVTTLRSNPAAGGFGSATFYPLAVGNTWNYEGLFRLTSVNPDGTPAGEPVEIQSVGADRIIGTEVIDGVSSFVREEVLNQSPDPYTGPYVTWSRMRQDRSGLFAADVGSNEPPTLATSTARYAAPTAARGRPSLDLALLEQHGLTKADAVAFAERFERLRDAARGWTRAAATTRAGQGGELTWLLYPLRIGLSWDIRPDGPWPARVDRVEMIDSKMGPLVAYRIETDPLGMPLLEGEYVRLFYGRVGYIGYSIHQSFELTDENGNPTGVTAIGDDTRLLVSTGPNS